mgnify:CR=1 FL=1
MEQLLIAESHIGLHGYSGVIAPNLLHQLPHSPNL